MSVTPGKVSVLTQLNVHAARHIPAPAFKELVRRTLRRFREILTPETLAGRRWYMVHRTGVELGQDVRVELFAHHGQLLACGFLASQPVEFPGEGKDRATEGEGFLANPFAGRDVASGSQILLAEPMV